MTNNEKLKDIYRIGKWTECHTGYYTDWYLKEMARVGDECRKQRKQEYKMIAMFTGIVLIIVGICLWVGLINN